MRKHQKPLLIAACLVILAITWALVSSNREPRYRGRTLSDWLIQATQSSDDPARQAVLRIGTNALPYLLEWIDYPTPTLKSRVQAFLQQARRNSIARRLIPESLARDTTFSHYQGALTGFGILGPVASPAAPELFEKLRTAPDWHTATACLAALTVVVPHAIPLFCQVITNPPPPGWTNVLAALPTLDPDMSPRVLAIKHLISQGTNAAQAVPALALAINDHDSSVAAHALLAVGLLGRGDPVTLPALTNALQDPRPFVRASAADALQRLGVDAKPAVPALMINLRDDDPKVREWTTNALLEIAPDLLTNTPAH